jgi:hypothetical protein
MHGSAHGIPIDTDGTLVANSDQLVPSQKAVRTYATAALGSAITSLTGEVTAAGGGAAAATIANNAITNAKMADNAIDTAEIVADAVTNVKLANMANGTIKGRATAGTGDPEDLTIDQLTNIQAYVLRRVFLVG